MSTVPATYSTIAMHDIDQNPQLAAIVLNSAAPTEELMQFCCNAIVHYFCRILRADSSKLIRYGIRPVVAPVAVGDALDRVRDVSYSPAWMHALIANDAEVAHLALRAVKFYAHRYATGHLELVSDEVGEAAMQVKAAAQTIDITLGQELEPTLFSEVTAEDHHVIGEKSG